MKTALVLGASGGVGGAIAAELVARGWTVRGLVRKPDGAPRIDGVQWVAGDALDAGTVEQAARGCAVIVHAVNPPGYRDWDKLVLPMLDNTIAAARVHGARIVLPGTLYNFGRGTAQPLRESTPQQPTSRKGAIRVEMERRLREGGARALVVRCGDFFGPQRGQNWFIQCLVRAGQPVRSVINPFERGVGHAWAYLPDVAVTVGALLARDAELADFDVFHFGGHWDADGMTMARTTLQVAGRPDGRIRQLPWRWLRWLAPAVPFLREVREVRYLAEQPFELDNAKLRAFLGAEPHTPLTRAIETTLRAHGCLPPAIDGVPAAASAA